MSLAPCGTDVTGIVPQQHRGPPTGTSFRKGNRRIPGTGMALAALLTDTFRYAEAITELNGCTEYAPHHLDHPGKRLLVNHPGPSIQRARDH